MNSDFKTLFICFYFPPFNRVGGRRWAKHIKYFQSSGEKFHVLAGDFDTVSPWDEDITTYKNKITRIPVSIYYPYYKQRLPVNLFQKIRWLISLAYNKNLEKKYKGNFWDDSRSYKKVFYTNAKAIIVRENITHVCLTVGPFSYASILCQLKNDFPDLNVTVDFRDYWEDGYMELNAKKAAEEAEKLEKLMDCVDLVLAPNPEMCEHYKSKFSKNTYCLPHCIDEDYLNIDPVAKAIDNTDFTILYGGALYINMENYVRQLIDIITCIKLKGISVKLKIFTMQPSYVELFKLNNIDVEIKPNLPTKQFIGEINRCDLLVLFRPDWSPNGFSTKFYEYIATRKPILYLGPKGDVNRFIIDNSLGYTLDNNTIESVSNKLLKNKETAEIPNKEFKLNQYSFEVQTQKFISFVKNYYINGN